MAKRAPLQVMLPDGTTRPMSRTEREEHQRDVRLAMNFLHGVIRDGPDDLPSVEFLSRDTTPTEDEARSALTRVLLSENVPPVIHWGLAAVFALDGFRVSYLPRFTRRAVLQNRNQGHPNNDLRDFEIAYRVDELRRAGMSADDARAKVGEAVGLHEDHIKKICRKPDLGFDPPPRARRKRRR